MSRAKDGERPLIDQAVAGNPALFLPGGTADICPSQPRYITNTKMSFREATLEWSRQPSKGHRQVRLVSELLMGLPVWRLGRGAGRLNLKVEPSAKGPRCL